MGERGEARGMHTPGSGFVSNVFILYQHITTLSWVLGSRMSAMSGFIQSGNPSKLLPQRSAHDFSEDVSSHALAALDAEFGTMLES